jgi:hypothetical protein
VTVSPQVRAVMDRLLATDAEIEEAEAARSMLPMLDLKEHMSEDEWRAYQSLGEKATSDAADDLEARSLRDMRWLANAKGREVNRLKREAKAVRTQTRAQVTREVLAEPVYRAMTFLKSGAIDGQKTDGPHKLYTPEIAAEYGEEKAALLEQLRGMTTSTPENGVHPAQVAELFGFTSVDHLLVELTSAEPLNEKIEGLTEQRLLEDHGDLTDPAAIEAAADKAVHNEARTRFVTAELSALSKAIGDRKTLAPAARAYAEAAIARQRVRDVKPSLYEAAAARAARASEKALKSGNLHAAASEKRNQLINLNMAREANRARNDVDRALAYLGRLTRAGAAKSIAPEYRAQIDNILESLDLRPSTTLRSIDRAESLKAFIEKQQDMGFEPVVDDSIFSLPRSYKMMTVEELRGLIDSIKNIEHLGRLKNRLLTAKRQREFDAAVATARRHHRNLRDPDPARSPRKRRRNPALKKAGLDGGRTQRVFDWAARAKDGVARLPRLAPQARQPHAPDGRLPRRRAALGSVRAADERSRRPGDDDARRRHQGAARHPQARARPGLNQKRFIPAIGRSLSLQGRMAVALNLGNPINRERVMGGERWTHEQVQAVVDTLTAEQWRVVQGIWEHIASYKPAIAAKERRVTGIEPEWTQPTPLTVHTADGETLDLAGGYYPIKYNQKRTKGAEGHALAEQVKGALRGAYTRATTKRGHLKARVESTGWPLRYDLGVAFQHVSEVIHDLTWHEYLIDATRLLRANPIDEAIRSHYGPEIVRALSKTLEDIAVGDIPASNAFERGINYLRTGATIAGMAWSTTTALLQPLGLAQSIVRIGPKHVAKGMARWIGDAAKLQSTVKWITEQSTDDAGARPHEQREINEIRNRVDGKDSAIRASASSSLIAEAAARRRRADLDAGMYEKMRSTRAATTRKPSALADQAVLDSQGGGQIKDLAGIQRGGPLMKLWTNFYSYFNVTYNLMAESVGETKLVGPKRLPLLAADVLMLIVACRPSLRR